MLIPLALLSQSTNFFWRTDPGLNWVSPVVLTEEQALDCLRHIETPLLSLMASPLASWYSEDKIRARQAATPKARHETVEGQHHFHMEAPERIVKIVQSFIMENDQEPTRKKGMTSEQHPST